MQAQVWFTEDGVRKTLSKPVRIKYTPSNKSQLWSMYQNTCPDNSLVEQVDNKAAKMGSVLEWIQRSIMGQVSLDQPT